jgi:hypothetical protein
MVRGQVGNKLARLLTLPWRQIASWIIANALILQLVLSPMAMLAAVGAGPDGVPAFALCTHNGNESDSPAPDGRDPACQLCLICSTALLLPDPSRVPVASSGLVIVQWTRLDVTVPRSRRLAQERSRGPPHTA